jgi:hypothetical protein
MTLREAARSAFGWERRRQLMSLLTGDDAPPWRKHEYKRLFGRKLIRSITAADADPWCRVVMNSSTRALVRTLNPPQLDALEISGEEWRDFGFQSYRAAHYPDYDICERALDTEFDLVIAEQVFEHLLWPYRAGRHVFQMLRPGGHALISTPFLFPVHQAPTDCSRWTETGLRYFLAECGFALDQCVTGSWGNPSCVRKYLKSGARYRPWRSLRNDPVTPIVVWALAVKPRAGAPRE